MQSQVLQAKIPVPERTNKVREAFQKATRETKSRVFELVPFTKKSEDGSNIIDFCDWSQWSQWSQAQ
jgi:hypothetical protein